MKKELFLLFVLILMVSFVSAKPACSDKSQVIADQNEIDKGSSRVINDLGIGLIKTDEINIIKEGGVIKKITAELIIDTRRLSLSYSSPSEDIKLLSGAYTVSFVNATDTKAKISINGESAEIIEWEQKTIYGLIVLLSEAIEAKDASMINAELIVGKQQLSLSSDEKPSEKITMANITFLIELISASETNAVIRVNKCKTGEIIEMTESTVKPESNQTINKTISNESTNQTDIEEQDTQQVSVAEIRERLRKLNETQSNDSLASSELKETKIGFFKRILNWFKRLLRSD